MRTSKQFRTIAVAIAAALTLSACGGTDETVAPEAPVEAAPEAEAPEAEAPEAELGTIVDIAVETAGFETLVTALTAADLVDVLAGEGPFTVFAPTDAAFDALPEGLLEKLLLPENLDVLVSILTYHVVAGTVLAADVTAGEVPTLQGDVLTVVTEGGVVVSDANVTDVDVLASNGVIHVIDAVMVPPSVDLDAL